MSPPVLNPEFTVRNSTTPSPATKESPASTPLRQPLFNIEACHVAATSAAQWPVSSPRPKRASPRAGSLSTWTKKRVIAIQEYALLSWQGITNTSTKRQYWSDLFTQMDFIGFGSLPIVLLTGMFTGGVLALQSNSALREFGALSMTPTLVTKSMLKELGPVITGLMVSGRNASGIASELGSMKITDQLDAMRALGADPMRKLVSPRLYATVIMLFFLTILSDAVGIGGGALVAVALLGLDLTSYWHATYQCVLYGDLIQGLIKPLFFGFIIASVGCNFGMKTTGGTQGVGHSTTQAVVFSSVFIIIVDFLISRTMIGIFGQ